MDATKTKRVLVGSTTGRGPCEECGLVAELHQVDESPTCAPDFHLLRDLCLPDALGVEGLPPLPHLALRAA